MAENVSGLLSINEGVEFETVLSDLEGAGYDTLPLHYPAASVGAPHRRDRIFIVAYAGDRGQRSDVQQVGELGGEIAANTWSDGEVRNVPHATKSRCEAAKSEQSVPVVGESCTDVADAISVRQSGPVQSVHASYQATAGTWQATEPVNGWVGDIWKSEPPVGRVAHGIPGRVDRLKQLGNAVVPQQAYPIFKTIAEMEWTKR